MIVHTEEVVERLISTSTFGRVPSLTPEVPLITFKLFNPFQGQYGGSFSFLCISLNERILNKNGHEKE